MAVEDWINRPKNKDKSWRGNVSRFVFSRDLDQEIRLVPRDHFRNVSEYINSLTLGELERRKLISIKTIPCGVKQREYSDEGETVPFVRTSDIGVMELRNPLKSVPKKVYEREKKKQDVQPYDILIIKDGTLRIGEPVMLLEDDVKLVLQGHFYKIRVLDSENLKPFFLYWAMIQAHSTILNMVIVQSTLSSITIDRLREIEIPYPSEQEQGKINTAVEEILRGRKLHLHNFPVNTYES